MRVGPDSVVFFHLGAASVAPLPPFIGEKGKNIVAQHFITVVS